MSDVRCTTCAAWEPHDENRRVGECRRRAPASADPRGGVTKRVWPTTGWGNWCLEHEHRVEVGA
jgi:hypothetical protein